jgi:hypothetical protein
MFTVSLDLYNKALDGMIKKDYIEQENDIIKKIEY